MAKGAKVYWTPGEKGVVHPVCPVDTVTTSAITIKPKLSLEDFTKIEGFENLYDHQTEAVNAVKAGANRLYLGWQPGLGKAQTLDAGVLTPSGYKRMGDVLVGDTVLTPQGVEASVLGVFPQGTEETYRITLTDGSSTVASGNHLWTLIKTVRNRKGTVHSEVTMTTEELMKSSLTESDGRCRYRVPDVNVSHIVQELPVDPYLLGVLIGDGGLSGDSVLLTSADQEIFDMTELLVPPEVNVIDTGDPVTKRLSVRLGQRNPLVGALRGLGLMGKTSYFKFIPDQYKYSSREQKISLIQGLMDTDGYVSKANVLEFCSVSERLANDFADLVRSIGGYARVAPKKTSWTHNGIRKEGSAYRVVFNTDFNPFRLRRKACVWRPVRQRQRRIKSIVPAGRAETQCIMIDHPDHLYVTDNYIPTHNTAGALVSAEIGNYFPLIIVAPSVTKINWQREAKHWLGREAQVLSGRTPGEITEDIVIINYEILSYWKDALIDLKAKGLVFDESHYIKNPSSGRTKASKAIAAKMKSKDMILMLSGTPTPNSVYDLVQPLGILGVLGDFGGQRNYIKRYCPPVQTRYGTSYARTRNLDELHTNLRNSCFIRRTKEECLDLPDVIFRDLHVDVKTENTEEFYAPYLEQMLAPTMAEARRVALDMKSDLMTGQIAEERSATGTAKIGTIVDLAMDIDEPLIIMVHHKEVQREVFNRLKKKRKVSLLTGGMTAPRRQQAIDDFQSGEVDIIVCSISAAGIGINLQRAESMILGELPLTYAEVDQAVSRAHRSGQRNMLNVTRVVAENTSDEIIIGMINRKEAVSARVEDGEVIDTLTATDLIAHRLLDLKKGVC